MSVGKCGSRFDGESVGGVGEGVAVFSQRERLAPRRFPSIAIFAAVATFA